MVDSMARRLMPCARREERGFTLIEVVMVLLLMALMAGLVFQWSPKLKAPDATTEHQKALMIARIAHARNQALLRDEEVSLKISNGINLQYVNMSPLSSSERSNSDSQVVTLKDVSLSTAAGSTNFTLTFKPDFTCSTPLTITITSSDDSTKTSMLTINGVGYAQ